MRPVAILRDAAEFIIGPRFARTRWRLLRMRTGVVARMSRQRGFSFKFQTSVHDLAARRARSFALNLSLSNHIEQGIPEPRSTRGLVRQAAQRKTHTSIQVPRK